MTFNEAIQTCLRKYADFNGRATRSEFWWWTLFVIIFSTAGQMVHQTMGSLFSLFTFLPSIAVAARRLHDIGRSGWWQLVGIIPILGWAVMIFWCIQQSAGPNEFDA